MAGPDEGDHAASSADRRREDEQLVAALRATGVRGEEYDKLVARFLKFGSGVLWKMVRNEEIWVELEKIQRPRSRPTYWSERDKEHLIADSVHDGFLDFARKVLAEGNWDSSRARLWTLFVRYCLGRFADHYQAWQRSSPARLGRQLQRDPGFRGSQQAPSAERVAMAKQAVTELGLEQFAHGVGYSHKEIGEMIGITDRAVEGRLRRAREKHPEDGRG
jgi:DNA-directed RNA polymerase specialized sigma24 family protein